MKFYDISRELFGSAVYPGDPAPECERLMQVRNGDGCNLTYLKMCTHNGTHMDAPRHFLDEGRAVDELPLKQVMGPCSVVEFDGILDAEQGKRKRYYGKAVLSSRRMQPEYLRRRAWS